MYLHLNLFKMDISKEDLRGVEFGRRMDAFPQNVILVREHGKWVMYRAGAQDSIPIHEQHAGQDFQDFVIEFLVVEMKKTYTGDYGFLDLVIEITLSMSKFKKYRRRLKG